MKSNSIHKRIDQRDFEWALLGELRQLERTLRDRDLPEYATLVGELAAFAGRKYYQTAADLRREKRLERHLPDTLAGVSPDHPIFGGKAPTFVRTERRPARGVPAEADGE